MDYGRWCAILRVFEDPDWWLERPRSIERRKGSHTESARHITVSVGEAKRCIQVLRTSSPTLWNMMSMEGSVAPTNPYRIPCCPSRRHPSIPLPPPAGNIALPANRMRKVKLETEALWSKLTSRLFKLHKTEETNFIRQVRRSSIVQMRRHLQEREANSIRATYECRSPHF